MFYRRTLLLGGKDSRLDQFMKAREDDLLHTHAPIVMRSMPVAVTRCSADVRYRWVSQRSADWVGLPVQEIVGRPIVDVLGEDGMRAIRPYIESVLTGKDAGFAEHLTKPVQIDCLLGALDVTSYPHDGRQQ
jgi:PAS domain-containing protein